MTKPKVLICGATGFIGHNIAERFMQIGDYEVHATGYTRAPWSHKDISWTQTNLCSDQEVDGLISRLKPDIIVQAAAVTSGCRDTFERPWLHVTDNAVMNSYILRSAFINKVKHVIYFSCSTMYPNGRVTEETPIAPDPKYFGMVNTKLYLEKMCEFYAGLGNTKFTVIRGSNFYGPHDKYDLDRAHVFGATVNKVINATSEVEVWGNGLEGRDILYVDDLVRFVECALANQKDNFGLYNCGAGEATSIGDLVLKIIKASGKKLAIRYDTTKPTIQVSMSLDCTKAERELGWKVETGLEDGIKKTLEWYMSTPDYPVQEAV